jgi:hypothetical protein
MNQNGNLVSGKQVTSIGSQTAISGEVVPVSKDATMESLEVDQNEYSPFEPDDLKPSHRE